jgi:hypothetical protein
MIGEGQILALPLDEMAGRFSGSRILQLRKVSSDFVLMRVASHPKQQAGSTIFKPAIRLGKKQ